MSEWWLIGILVLLAVIASSLFIYPIKRHVTLSMALFSGILVAVALGYYQWGGYAAWRDYVRQNNSRELAQQMLKTMKSPQELIDKLRAKLDDTPNSAKGWYLLGRLYTNQQDQAQAVVAFRKAYQFQPADEQFAVNYAHSLWQANNQQLDTEIRGIFNKLLANNPNQPDALAMLAMDAYQNHQYQTAIDLWQRLLKLAPPQSEEADALRKAIVKAEEQLK